ncbi:aminoacyl-tRNA deacylase [Catelliglobosispora koreensis]|uniref:aminoacyl-tRNA deacylase n=1 Tax=Catelliglobosispora koreensis TaxID=129052 RepID=UPI0003700CE0
MVTNPNPNPVFDALAGAEVSYRVIRYGSVRSASEAAKARGVEVADVVKTIVTRRGDNDYVFVLIPGDRTISWPKLRKVLGVNRLSMPDAATAKEVTGYERGTITPFGSVHPWPVIADERIEGRQITLGAGEHGMAIAVDADAALKALNATLADVTEPESAE